MNDNEIQTHCGHDAYIYLKTLEMMFWCCFASFFPTGFILLFCYYIKSSTLNDWVRAITIRDTEGNGILWLCVIGAYIICSLTMYIMKAYFKLLAGASDDFFVGNKYSYTVMVTGVPEDYRRNEKLKQHFVEMFADSVQSVSITERVDDVAPLQEKLKDASAALEYYEKLKETTLETPMIRTVRFGERVDAVDHYERLCEEINSKLRQQLKKSRARTPVAFVTFGTMSNATVCAATRLEHDFELFNVKMAPPPDDVNWNNLHYEYDQQICLQTVYNILFFILIFFWTIPVASVQAFVNVETLNWITNGLSSKFFHRFPSIGGVVTGFIPVLATQFFLLLLPYLLYWLTTLRKRLTKSEHNMSLTTRYFKCLFVIVLLASAISNVTLASLSSTIQNVNDFFRILASNLPKVSTYFLNYIIVVGFVSVPMDLLRISYICKSCFCFLAWGGITQYPMDKEEYLYWTWFPFHMLVFTLCQTYAVVTPFVSLLGALYFIIIYICTIYQVMIYFPIPEDTGVRNWPKLWRHCTTGLYLSQFLLLGVIILMKGIYQAPFVIALFLLTWRWNERCIAKYEQAFSVPSLSAARRYDKRNCGLDFKSLFAQEQNEIEYVPQFGTEYLDTRGCEEMYDFTTF